MNIRRYFSICIFLLGSNFIHATNIGTFIVLSDIHYNPRASNNNYPSIQKDSNTALLDAVINNIGFEVKKQKLKPDFFMITGDFLAHNLERICPNKNCLKDAINYPLQSIWTVQNGLFKNIPLFAALGNNDSYSGDYLLSTTDGFFDDIGMIFAKYAFPKKIPAEFLSSYKDNYGSYTTSIPATCKKGSATACKDIMVLNTIPFSSKAALAKCGNGDCNALRKKIIAYINQQITAHGMPTFVAVHISDPPNYLLGSLIQSQISEQTKLFLQCTKDNQSCIKAIIAGHMHFFIPSIQTGATKNVSTLLAPSVTPIDGATPGYLIISYDRDSGRIIQIQHHFIEGYAKNLAEKVVTTPIPWNHQAIQSL